jgi:protein CWC15
MTTAHRPQLDPASGKSTLAGHPASHHSRAGQLPQFTYLKEKLAKKIEREELKRQLLEAEGKHFGKTSKTTGAADRDDDEPKTIIAEGDGASPSGTKRKLNVVGYESSDDEAGKGKEKGAAEPAAKKLKSAGEDVSSSDDSDSDGGDNEKRQERDDSDSDTDEEEDEARKKWLADVQSKYKDVDADSHSSSSSGSDSSSSDEEDDEDALLAREMAKIRAERAAQKAKEDAERDAEAEEQRTVNIALGNPLLNKPDYTVKKAWYDDTVFKNQARDDPDYSKKQRNEFINDLLRSDFNKRFMKKYVR